MSGAARSARYTYEEYRRFEESTDARHEFLDGQILAMAGGTPEHAALIAAIIGMFERVLAGTPCNVFSSDLRVRIAATGLATYPDVTIICGDFLRDAIDPNAAANPTILVEVLSDSTEDYDRSEKKNHYATITSLRHYLIVSHRQRRVDAWSLQPNGSWLLRSAGRGDTLSLAEPSLQIAVDAIYDRSPLTRSL